MKNINGASKEINPFTRLLFDYLRKKSISDVVTDAEVKQAFNIDISPKGNGYVFLQSAIKRLEKEYQVVWKRIPKEHCIKCLTAKEIIEVNAKSRASVRRKAARGYTRTGIVLQHDVELNDADKKENLCLQAAFGVISKIAGPTVTRQLLKNENLDTNEINTEVLKLFK